MKTNPFLDLAVFPDSPVDMMTLRTHVERSRLGHEINVTSRNGRDFMLGYHHQEEDGGRVILKIKGKTDDRNHGLLLPAPVACFFYEGSSERPTKSVTLYSDRPSKHFNEHEGQRYLAACQAAWEYISIHSTIRRGDL